MRIKTRIPPPLYALATAALIWLLGRELPSLRVIPSPWNEGGWALMGLGMSVDGLAVLQFLRLRTTVNPMRPDRSSELVVTGLNAVSRNPMYLGLVLTLCGWSLLLGNPFGWLLTAAFAHLLILVQIEPEETSLLQSFGEPYRHYCRRVHRWLGRSS